MFIKYLKEYLEPRDEEYLQDIVSNKNTNWDEKDRALKLLKLNNFHTEIELIAFCLMPNHFHLLVKQGKRNSLDSFTNSLLTRYAIYFNKRHKRVGKLFQDVYKAVLIDSEQQLLHLSRYIHQNPVELKERAVAHQLSYTSLPEFLGNRNTDWIKPDIVLSYFRKAKGLGSYREFVQEPVEDGLVAGIIMETAS